MNGSKNDPYESVPWEVAIEWRRIIGSPFCPLPPVTKWILTVLSRYGDKCGDNIFPSQRELAFRAGVTAKTVNKALQKADKDGWIIRRPMDRPNGKGYKSHCYTLTIPGFVADYAIGKYKFWEPRFTEKIVKRGDDLVVLRRHAS